MSANYPTERVAIVGGGLAGLAAATYLARGGRQVTVFERSKRLGGRGLTQHYGEFYFNEGPHALYRGGPAMEVLDELGIKYSGSKVKAKGSLGLYRGELVLLPSDPTTLLTSPLLGWKGRWELINFFTRLLAINPAKLDHLTVQEWAETNFKDATLRKFLLASFRVASYTNAPTLQSAGSAIRQLQMAFKNSVLYLNGGWQTLIDGLVEAAQKAGAEIVTGARVVAVEHDEAVRGVRLDDGTFHPAGAVLVAGSPHTASELVDNGHHPELAALAQQLVPVQAACLDIGLRRLPVPHNKVVLGLDRPLYFSVHSVYARLGPEGSATIHLAQYLDPAAPHQPKEDERELEALLDKAQPGWRDELVERRFLPRMTVTNAVVSAAHSSLNGRPAPQVASVPNLYVAGDWVGPQGQLSDAALASASQAARHILKQPASQKPLYSVGKME